MARNDPGFLLRMPVDLKEWVMTDARQERRSINGHLVFLVEKARKEANDRQEGGTPAAGQGAQT